MIIIFCLLFYSVSPKFYLNQIPFNNFRKTWEGWVYLTRITLSPGTATIQLKTTIKGFPHGRLESIDLSFITSDNFQKQSQPTVCRDTSLSLSHSIEANGEQTKSSKIFNVDNQTSYYVILRDCQKKLKAEYHNYNMYLNIQLLILNNSSHFGEDQDQWFIHVLSLFISIYLFFKIFKRNPIGTQFDWSLFILNGSIFTNAIASLFKSTEHLIYWIYGTRYGITDAMYLGFHSISQSMLICLIIFMAFGWTINFKNVDDFDLYIPLMTLMSVFNILLTVLNKIDDNSYNNYYAYDTIPGAINKYLHYFITLIAIIGFINTLKKKKTKIRKLYFIKKLGIISILYCAWLPFLMNVVNSQIQPHFRQQIFANAKQASHLLTILFFAYEFLMPKSEFSKICAKNESFLDDEEKFA